MTWNDFFQSVNAGKFSSVYLFTGPEEWIKREALETLKAKLLPPGLEELNDASLEGVTARQIIDAAETMPMMCERRVVTVRDWGPLLPGKTKDEDIETEKLQKWLENPPESSVTVFYMRSDPDGRKKATSLLKKKAEVISFEYLSDSELAKWTARRLKPAGKKITAQALNTLAFMASRDLTRLAGEIDKLIAFSGERAEISEADVREIVAASLEYNVFELINRLLEGNLAEAQRMTNTLLQSGQNSIGILAMLTRQLRQLAHMRYALDSNEPVTTVQTLLKMHPYAASQTAKQCKKLSAGILQQLYELCVESDYNIKSGRLRDSAALEAILIKIASTALASRRN